MNKIQMKTEDLPLDVKRIFERKNVPHTPQDIARMRYLCKTFVEFVLETKK